MTRTHALAIAGLLSLFAAGAPMAHAAFFNPESVDLPAGDERLPPGPNLDTVAANCVTCHSAAMITTQPKLSRAAWEGEVNKMIGVYKAPIHSSAVPAIVDYLAAVKGS